MTRTTILLLTVLLLALLLVGTTAAKTDPGQFSTTLPIVAKTGPVCLVTLFEDGSWSSPDYSVGEPWPPSCKFVIGQ